MSETHGKLLPLDELVRLRERWRAEGRRVVWANGCFDLVHAGHARQLRLARERGDALIVGLNSDRSVRSLKGQERPLMPQAERAEMIGALRFVDAVLVFDGKRCTPELEALRPDVYVRGSDYTPETVDPGERAAVEAGGGRVEFLPLVEGVSTTLLLKRIRRSDPEKVVTAAFALWRDREGRLLMVANRYLEGVRWGLPGGGQVRGEALDRTLRRELAEEVGASPSLLTHRAAIERIDATRGLHLLLHLFEVGDDPTGLALAPGDADIAELAWFDSSRMRSEPGCVLGRTHWLRYLADPTSLKGYTFMGEGEE